MNNSQVPTTQVAIVLASWVAAETGWDNAGDGVDVALYVNDHVPMPSDTIANYTACTVSGAVALPTLAADVYSFSDGSQGIALPTLASYTPTVEPDPAVTAYGWVAKNHGSGALVAAGRFTDPIVLHNGVTVAFEVVVSGPLNWTFPNPVSP